MRNCGDTSTEKLQNELKRDNGDNADFMSIKMPRSAIRGKSSEKIPLAETIRGGVPFDCTVEADLFAIKSIKEGGDDSV